MNRHIAARLALGGAALALCATLVACGGSGSDTPTGTGTDSLPLVLTVSVSVPATRHDTGAPIAFSSNAASSSSGLTYRWNFGDGSLASTSAAPQHAFSRAGTYRVWLIVTNSSGATVSATMDVVIADKVST